MLVYGDHARRVHTATMLNEIGCALGRLPGTPPGIERHTALVTAFIDLGELVQGIADAEFNDVGADARSRAQDAAMTALMAMADAVRRSWESGFSDQPPLPPDILERLSTSRAPDRISIKKPEGYAFYALYPESYIEAARMADCSRPIRVIGIRSIGTGLAALVASVVGASAPITVRPIGDPFQREIRLADELAEELLSDPEARFAVVDEGPGLSGSSFAAVADWLETRGVARADIHFFPSHGNDVGAMASAPHRERWQGAHRHVVDFGDLILRAPCPAQRLDSWITDLIGPLDEPLQDISGGSWRSHRFAGEAAWPPCHVQQERRKFLVRATDRMWLLKFVGLGRESEKLEIARKLHEAGFTPEPAGYRHGFLVEHWIEDAQPPTMAAVDRTALIARLGSYIAFRAQAFPAEPDEGASPSELFRMARYNTACGLGEETAAGIDAWESRLTQLEQSVCRVRTDNRLQPWEWLLTGDGRLLKTDALDHHAAHDLVGCQDAAWDLAAAKIEFDLSGAEASDLVKVFERVAQRPVSRDLLAFYEVCYAAFQLGHWSMASDSLVSFPAEALRTRAAADNYRGKLRQMLSSR